LVLRDEPNVPKTSLLLGFAALNANRHD
jgi:hypothetical protein